MYEIYITLNKILQFKRITYCYDLGKTSQPKRLPQFGSALILGNF